ncbi:MAG: AAA family ATPase [Methanothrix sp.]|nr:AAA family ATPase [Methanothrix sp.]MDD4447306.1 AAA family ATPase [Methanothrix sp.]
MSSLQDWQEANQKYLMAELAVLQRRLERYIANLEDGKKEEEDNIEKRLEEAMRIRDELAKSLPGPCTLDAIAQILRLTSFERDLLLLCAGPELDFGFASLCSKANSGSNLGGSRLPSFALASVVLPEVHWSAFTPAGPLRRWHLIEMGDGDTLISSPLRVDERVLHYLLGIDYQDERLGALEPVAVPQDLPDSYRDLACLIEEAMQRSDRPAVQLLGNDSQAKRDVAAYACAKLGLRLYAISSEDIPLVLGDREKLAWLWEREAFLSCGVLLVDCEELEGQERTHAAHSLVEGLNSHVMIAARQPLRLKRRAGLSLEVASPRPSERQMIWQKALGPLADGLDGQLEALVDQFDLGQREIQAASAQATILGKHSDLGVSGDFYDLGDRLWDACRIQARPRLEELAQRIEPAATWEDLVLPESLLQILREIGVHLRQSSKVYESWGFGSKGSRGLGISALFAGDSGTGKTMAAEVLANDLKLDLYRIDLSQVVSKYIGETEKNLRKVFDAADRGGAILLFDEADALFGKRSEVKDSHDRYANIETSYLLQRMEEYRGLAILTTNMRSALDRAFLRRIRFVVQFPFPNGAERASIWERVFPSNTPQEGLDFEKLARLNVAGGNIRNIALYAAFLAAEDRSAVKMSHLVRAARVEYAKLERPLTEADIGGWT